ncbi:MAG TPA: thermonuclease family protein [Bdellovibrionota bacterium]|nr:thermonuclease family protein [Bdellovibrionota bacterium]
MSIALFTLGCSRTEKTPGGQGAAETPAAVSAEGVPEKGTTTSPQEIFTGESAKVLKVVQADTLKISMGKKKYDVKLYGVVLPGKKPAVMAKAKKFAADLVLGKEVLVDAKGKDRKGRIFAMVSLPPGPNLNHELVREGYAQWNQKHAKDIYAKDLQDQAKMAKKGMWAEPKKKRG